MSASSDYLSTLSRLSEAKAAGQANAITAAAQAQAEATRANAGLWGNSIATIGQMVAQYPEQQARLQQIKNQAANTELERQRLQMQTDAARRAQAGEDQANQIIAALPRNSDGTYDTGALTQKLAAANVPLPAQEKLTTSIDNMNKVIASFNTSKVDHAADLANSILTSHAQGEPIDADAVHFGLAAAKAAGLANDQDEKQFTDLMAQGASPEQVLKSIRNVSEKYKTKPPEPYTLAEGAKRFGPNNELVAENPKPVAIPKTWAEIALDAKNDKSPTQAMSQQAWETHQKVETEKALNPASVEYYVRAKYGDKPTPDQVLKAHEEFAKATAHGTAAGDIPVKVEKYDPTTGRTTITYMPRSQAVGQNFEKPPSATLANRLESARAVNQTGDDIINSIRKPEVAALLGPLAGRYNTVRDFIGDPPPELAELAGQINSFAIAQMGVHGMRNAQAAQKIEEMLSAKFTPESLISKIKGINNFGTHLLQNQGRDTGSSSTPNSLPSVGSTFQGGKVLKVTPVP